MYKFLTKKQKYIAGFSLTELLVSVGIISMVTVAVMVRHSSFNSAVIIENIAYEISFDIRQTQTRAASPQVSVLEDALREGYGIRFVDQRTYEIFQADGGNLGVKRTVTRQTLDNRFEMSLSDGNNDLDYNSYIFFQRPDFDAKFYDDNNEQSSADQFIVNVRARAEAEASDSGVNITVSPTGQISVSRP